MILALGLGLLGMNVLSACQQGQEIMPPEVATQNHDAISPSGNYTLTVVALEEGGNPYQRFEIRDRKGQILFSPPEQFSARHTTVFLWDALDRAWVYSGDIGTFYWERQASSNDWQKWTYPQAEASAPAYLKQLRPKFFPK